MPFPAYQNYHSTSTTYFTAHRISGRGVLSVRSLQHNGATLCLPWIPAFQHFDARQIWLPLRWFRAPLTVLGHFFFDRPARRSSQRSPGRQVSSTFGWGNLDNASQVVMYDCLGQSHVETKIFSPAWHCYKTMELSDLAILLCLMTHICISRTRCMIDFRKHKTHTAKLLDRH